MISVAVACSFLALVIAFLAIAFVIVSFGRLRTMMRAEFDDPTSYKVVTDGKLYRVRGPFDTFYTIRFHDRDEAQQYAEQLANWARQRSQFDEGKWRAA
jgi:hypothetical protein